MGEVGRGEGGGLSADRIFEYLSDLSVSSDATPALDDIQYRGITSHPPSLSFSIPLNAPSCLPALISHPLSSPPHFPFLLPFSFLPSSLLSSLLPSLPLSYPLTLPLAVPPSYPPSPFLLVLVNELMSYGLLVKMISFSVVLSSLYHRSALSMQPYSAFFN